MIIGFCGEKGVGKDTAGAYLIKEYEFERRGFADPLKKAVAALFNIPYWEVDKHKLDPTVWVAVGYKNIGTEHIVLSEPEEGSAGHSTGVAVDIPKNMWSPISEYVFREMLQRFGTEMARDVFGHNFWVDQALPVDGFYQGRKIVITDVRYQNELDRIHNIGGIICRIKRPDVVNEDPHSSENIGSLRGIDYEIMNDSTEADFLLEVDSMLDQVLS